MDSFYCRAVTTWMDSNTLGKEKERKERNRYHQHEGLKSGKRALNLQMDKNPVDYRDENLGDTKGGCYILRIRCLLCTSNYRFIGCAD